MPGQRKRPRLDEGVGEQGVQGVEGGRGDERDVVAVLADELLAAVPLADCHVGVIADPKHTSRLIRALNDAHPIPTLQHLKRVRRRAGPPVRIEVLLAPAMDFASGADCLSALKAAGVGVQCLDAETLVAPVPAAPPRTRAQFAAASEYWACNFHEDAALEKLITGRAFDDADLEKHRRWMRRATAAARRGCGTEAGAVVVDPARDALVAEAADGRTAHPLRHAAMNAIDLVAWSQAGGAWPVQDGDVYDDDLPDKPPPVGTVRNREDADDDEKPVGPYLCTGYDVYLAREPCTMCAMALVHSRVRRVFYAAAAPHGVLGSAAKVHTVRALNHHYQVFRGPPCLPKEAS